MRQTPLSDIHTTPTILIDRILATRGLKLTGCLVMALILAACASTQSVSRVAELDRLDAIEDESPRILVMPPDVKYYLLTTGGVSQPHAEWTIAARRNFEAALQGYADDHGTEIQMIADPEELSMEETAYQKLYSAVGTSILIHHFGPLKLPTKNGTFDWSLGPGVRSIGDNREADYALFTYYRDYQASGGRIAFALLAAAVGVGMSMGSEGGFASLIDLKNGEIVWFNKVLRGEGELRDPDGARQAVDILFEGLPQG